MNGSAEMHSLAGRAKVWLIITSAVILTTLLLGYTLTDSPRSWMTWTVLVFICFVEFAAGMTAAESSRADSAGQTSSAIASVVVGSAGIFGLIGLVTVALSLVLTEASPKRDAVVISLLVVETAAFLIGMVLLRHSDLELRAHEQTSVEANRGLVARSTQVREAANTLRSLKTSSVDQSLQVESVVKDLESCASRLCHSHRTLPEAEASLDLAIGELEAIGAAVAKDGWNKMFMERLAKIQKDLQSFTSRLDAR